MARLGSSVRLLKVLAAVSQAGASALSALWTFPSILVSAFLVAWGAEAAQFLISQGLALALLAWLQTLPEFAVEAVIAWEAGKDPARAHLAIANLTGAIRLRSEEHTSELQSQFHLVCRLLLEKKKSTPLGDVIEDKKMTTLLLNGRRYIDL